MKLSKICLLAASAIVLMTAGAANATVQINGLFKWKVGTAGTTLSAGTFGFSVLANSPGAVNLGSFQATLNGVPVAETLTGMTFGGGGGFTMAFAGSGFTLNFDGPNWSGGFPAGPLAFGIFKANVVGDAVITNNVQISLLDTGAVPEPATWALMLGGFGLAGAMLRSRVAKDKIRYAI